MASIEKRSEAPLLHIDLVACVPQTFQSVLQSSIIARAQEKGIVSIATHNLHDYAEDKYHHIDDAPFGGGAGMIIKCEPVFACIENLQEKLRAQHATYDEIIYLSPDGEQFSQATANELSLKKNLLLLSGHYKGIDQRIRDTLVTREISIGDYVLSGGELASLVVVDAVVRLLPGVLGSAESALEDSFMDGTLDTPHYTRPADFRGMTVPEVLLGGNHALIREWREEQALQKTRERRPDLLQ